MPINFGEFIKKWNGKKADWDGAYGGQCVDLFRFYNHEVLDISQPKGVVGAADFWTNYSTDPVLKNNFTKIDNTPDFLTISGDVVIWDKNAGGGFGHIAIATGENDGLKFFKSFDQNWSKVSYCEIVNHSYKNVLGVLRPKKVPSNNNPMPENPSKLLTHMGVKTEQEGIEVWDRETAFLKDEREKVERLKIDLEVEEKATNIARENHQKDLDMLAKLLNSQAGIEAIEKEVRHLLSVEEEKRQLQVKYDREIIEHKKTYEESQRELEKLRSENERLREQNKIDREEFEKKLENQQLQIDNAIKKSNEAKEKLESAQNEVFEGLYAWLKSIFKRK